MISPTRSVPLTLLSRVRIASPCPMKWEQMTLVDDVTRHCAACNLHVHNLSGMTAPEAEAFLASRSGADRTCAAWYQRADGTILTQDCPVGLRAARLRLARGLARFAAVFALVLTSVAIGRSRNREARLGLAATQPFVSLCDWARGSPSPTGVMIPGMVAPFSTQVDVPF